MRKLLSLLTALLFAGSMWGATYNGTFTKITSANDLTTGYYVIVASETASNADYALGSTITASNNRVPGVEVTITSGTTITDPDDAIVYLITKNGNNYTFQNVNTSKYLYQSGTTSGKGMGFQNTSANITLAGYNSENPLGFKFTLNGTSNNILKYNNNNKWFANYANDYSTTMTPVRLFKCASTPSTVAAPEITGNSEFEGSVEVSISCETTGTTIYYTLDGSAPSSTNGTEYTAAFTLTETTSVKAIAIKGEDASSITTKSFTKIGPFTCAEVYGFAKGTSLSLNNVTVTCVGGKNVFVKDATGAMLLYLPADATWKAGDVLSNVRGTLDIYNGLYEVKPTSDQVSAITATAGTAPDPEELTAAPTDADMNKYVIFKNVTVDAGSFEEGNTYTELDLTIGTDVVTLRNSLAKEFTFVGGTNYNVTGAVAKNNSGLLVYFNSAAEKGCENEVAITKGAETNGTYELSAEKICGDDEGGFVQVSNIEPAAGYEFDEITTSASGTVDNDNKKVTGITAATTITVVFKAKPKYTVSFSTGAGNPTVNDVQETVGGEGITLPAGVTPKCKDWTFAGWAAAAVAEATTTAPTLLAAETNYKPASDVTLYAVYSKTEGASEHYGGSYAAETEYTLEGYTFKIQQIYKNGEKMQWRAYGNSNGTGLIYNTETFPAKISSIVLTYDSSDGNKNHTLNVGDEENPAEGTAIDGVTDGLVETFDCSAANADYFLLANGSNAGYTSSIAINYGNAGTTTYISSPSCTPTAVDNVEVVGSAVKVLRNGILLIEKNGHTYNAMGQLVK